MNEEIFIEKMMDILDAEEEISMDTQLDDVEEWDSLSVVSYVAMANTACGKKIEPKTVREAETIRDLYELLQ